MARKSPKGKQKDAPNAMTKQTPQPEATSAVVVASTKDDKISKEERMKRFKDLCLRRNEARNANRSEVVAENQRNKTSAHEVAKREKAQRKLDHQVKRTQVEQAGGDYDRQVCMETDAETSQRWQRKAQHSEADTRFDGHRIGAVRKYDAQMVKFKPDLAEYERRKVEASLADDGHVTYGGSGKVSSKDLDRLGEAVDASIQKSQSKSRRKEFFSEADVDYINQQNERYNAKLRRAFDPYTKDIKSNLERGTAL